MQPNQELPKRLNQEFDRYLIGAHDPSGVLPREDEPEFALGMQLLNTDYSHQSKLRAYLRRNIEFELGTRLTTPAHRLIHQSISRRWAAAIKHYLPAFITLVLILGTWLWKTVTPIASTDSSMLRPSPEVIVATVLVTNQQPVELDPRPIPTPLSPSMIYASTSSSSAPILQQTPLGLPYPSSSTTQP